jgi:hypothetical protein
MAASADGPSATTTSPATTMRSIASRRGLPNGRALVGALLVTVAAVGTYTIATGGDEGPDTSYLVLVDDVHAGETIELTDLSSPAMALTADVAATAERDPSSVAGATALHLLRAGTILDSRSIARAAVVEGTPIAGAHELTLPVPRDEDALVLRFDDDPAGIGGGDDARLTLAVPDPDLVVDATLRSYDSITVVLTSRAIDDRYPDRSAPVADPSVPDPDPVAP